MEALEGWQEEEKESWWLEVAEEEGEGRTWRWSQKIDVPSDLVITTCPGIIAQLLTNLISNAQRHAFGPSVNNEVNKVAVTCGKNETGIVISVQDNGKGIPAELHKKVFEPFYTTARDKGGTGLGLNILYNLVRQKFNGEIDLVSSPGEGTTITVCIPVES